MIQRTLKEMFILTLAFIAFVYLIFPTLGIFELIPDAIPLIGSMDEGAATLILLNTLNYYGFDLTNLYGKPRRKHRRRRSRQLPPDVLVMRDEDDETSSRR